MADETMKGTHGFLSVHRGGTLNPNNIVQRTLSVGGNTAKAGMILTTTGETAGYVDQAGQTDQPYGILLAPSVPADTYDIDDAIDDGTLVDIYLLPSDGTTEFAMFLAALAGPVAVVEGAPIGVDNVTAANGKVALWAYTNATDQTDNTSRVIGRAAMHHAGHATEVKILVVRC